MKAACDTIRGGENDAKLECFAGQYNKYEGLTVNFDEAVHGAGGVIVGEDGKPNVATPEPKHLDQHAKPPPPTDWIGRSRWKSRRLRRPAEFTNGKATTSSRSRQLLTSFAI